MALDRLLFGAMYRLGFTPWDGHPLPDRFREIAADPKGRALDIGCGTGNVSILLAKAGWDVTAVDLVDVAVERARAKAEKAGAKIRFLRADATRLRDAGLGDRFDLIVDMGCLHGMSDAHRDLHVPQLKSLANEGARHFIVAFKPPSSSAPPPRGIDADELRRRLSPDWTFVADGDAPTDAPKRTSRWYEHLLKGATAR